MMPLECRHSTINDSYIHTWNCESLPNPFGTYNEKYFVPFKSLNYNLLDKRTTITMGKSARLDRILRLTDGNCLMPELNDNFVI